MSHPLTPELLARVVRDELDTLALSEREIQARTGRSRDTLKRRVAAGELSSRDLLNASALLGIKLSALARRAEKVAESA